MPLDVKILMPGRKEWDVNIFILNATSIILKTHVNIATCILYGYK